MPILLIAPYGPEFVEVIKKYSEAGSPGQIAECATSLEAVALARQLKSCVILIRVEKQLEWVKHSNALKLLGAEIRSKKIRVVMTTKVKDPPLLQQFRNAGCAEILQEPISIKSFTFKVDRHLKALLPFFAKNAAKGKTAEGAAEAAEGEQGGEAGKAKAKNKAASTVRMVEALKIDSDCWLMAGGNARKITGRWMVKLTGPGPGAGRWMRLETKEGEAESWEWDPFDVENDPFITEAGHWVFKGKRPEFQDNLWLFVGSQPELGFYYEGQLYGAKVSTNEVGTVLIAKDSPGALKKYSRMQETFRTIGRKKVDPNAAAAKAKAEEEEKNPKGEVTPSSEAPELESRAEALGPGSKKRKKEKRGFGFGSGGAMGRGGAKDEAKITLGPPVSLESDCWLLHPRKPRFVNRRWIIKLVGPSPAVGRWAELESTDPGDPDQFYQWIPHDPENDPFIREEGAWLFHGSQPRFDEDGWLFIGKRPELAFYYEKQNFGAKVSPDGDGNSVILAKDSHAAIRALPAIQESFKRVIKKEGEEGEGEAAELAGDKKKGEDDLEGLDSDSHEGEVDVEGYNAPGLVAGDEDERQEFRYPLDHFGVPGGIWDFACNNAQGGKWFAYVTKELLDGDVPDVREMDQYWIFLGPEKPKLNDDGTEWVFINREPEICPEFRSLLQPVQEFYYRFLTVEMRVKNDERESAELSYEGEGEGPGTELSYEGEAEGRGDELEAEQESPDAGTELEYRGKDAKPREIGRRKGAEEEEEEETEGGEPDAIADAPEAKAGRAKTAAAKEAKKRRKEEPETGAIDEAAAMLEDEAPEPELEAEPKPESIGERARRRAQEKAAKGQPLKADEEAGQAADGAEGGPAAVAADEPPGPTLSPLALAFLMSELMAKQGAEPAWMAQRFCAYVTASCGGLRAELWVKESGAAWVCAGTSDGEKGQYVDSLSSAGAEKALFSPKGVCVASVISGGAVIGVLALGGKFAERVAPEYVQAGAAVARGLLTTLTKAA